MVHDYAEDLLQSIRIVAEYCYKDQKFDETLICTVINDNDCKNGHYIVSDGNIKFDAYSDSADYRVDDVVRVTIIKGDYSQKKYIAGKCVSEESNQPLTYVSPSASVLDMTSNLIKDVAEGGLIANSGRTYNDAVAYEAVCIWSTNLQDSEFKDIQNNSIYDSIVLKADFKTMLSEYNITSGSYGLYMDLYVTTAGNGENYSRKRFYLDSSDMFGDPYNFLIYSNQEAKFNIAQTDTIHVISLYFYQENNFIYRDNNGSYLKLQKNPLNIADLLVSNIYVGMGTDLVNAKDNKLVIYTHDDLKYNIDDTETSNQKEIGLIWYNKDEDNKYIGFSDGVIRYNDSNEIIPYDEKEYLDKSAVITRLAAQQGREGVPDDKTALELSADLDELKVVLPKIKKAVAKNLYTELKNFSSRLNAIQAGVAQYFNPWLDKNSETNINKRSENLEASINSLIDYYVNGLACASAVQAGEEAEFEEIESLRDYENGIINSLNNSDENNPLGIIPDIRNFLNELKITIKTSYSSFMGAYDAYEIRIQKILQDIQKCLDEFKTISKYNYEKFAAPKLIIDGTVIKGILLRTTEEFEPYIPEDLSIYDNQYCIYWYQYQSGYEGDAFGSSDWKLLDANNVGLPNPTDEGKYPPKAAAADSNAILHLSLHTANREEKFKAVLFYNHVQYNSNEIIFINERPVLDEVIKNNIIIEHGNNSYDSYAKYGVDNILIDAADYNRPRTLRLRYTDEQGNFDDNKLIGASVYWYIPNNATQLRCDLKDFSEDFTNDIDSKVKDDEFAREGFTCFYRKITGKEEKIDSTSREFIYRIADYFAPTNTQNTIYCVVVKGQVKIEASISFDFSTFGSNGTDYTLRISPASSQVATTDSIDENENQLLFDFEAVLYDYNNEKIDIVESNEVQVKVITPLGKEALTPQFQDGKIIGSIGAPTIDTNTNVRCYYRVLEVTVPIHWKTTDKTVQLTAYYVVPYALTSVYYIEGPSTVVYDSQGGNPSYYKNPFKLFWNKEADGAVAAQEDNEITWNMVYYYYDAKTKKMIQMSAGELDDEYKIVKSYMPSLSSEYILTPSAMYLQEEQMTLYPVVLGTKNDVVYWAQPIYLMQNRYPSAMLNSWDGSLKIDEENGTILSNLVGAGKKNSDNSFSGVLMGEVEANVGIQVDGANLLERSLASNQTGMGLYGFHEGAQSFGFNINGTAFLGKSGGGRISFDGNHGFIYSQSWLNSFKRYKKYRDDEEIPFENDYKEIDGERYYWTGIYNNPFNISTTTTSLNQGSAGMAIDLQSGHIDAYNFKLTSDGIQLNASPENDENYFLIGHKNNTYLEYNADGSLGINISNGYINAATFKLDAWRNNVGLYLNSSPNLDNDEYYFRVGNSTNYIKFKDDLEISAYHFILDAWNDIASEGLYLNSNSDLDYYLRIGNATDYITYSTNGTLTIAVENLSIGSTNIKDYINNMLPDNMSGVEILDALVASGWTGIKKIDNQFVINATAISTGYFQVIDNNNKILFKADVTNPTVELAGWNVAYNGIYKNNVGMYNTWPTGSYREIARYKGDNWRFVAGDSFGVDRDGNLYTSSLTSLGEENAKLYISGARIEMSYESMPGPKVAIYNQPVEDALYLELVANMGDYSEGGIAFHGLCSKDVVGGTDAYIIQFNKEEMIPNSGLYTTTASHYFKGNINFTGNINTDESMWFNNENPTDSTFTNGYFDWRTRCLVGRNVIGFGWYRDYWMPINNERASSGDCAFIAPTGDWGRVGLYGQWSVQGNLYNSAGSSIITSARLNKHSIESLDNRYINLLNYLSPVRFKYNSGTSNRYHTGLILDELKSAMDNVQLSAQELSAYCLMDQNNPEGDGGIRYIDLIPIIIAKLQKIDQQLQALK